MENSSSDRRIITGRGKKLKDLEENIDLTTFLIFCEHNVKFEGNSRSQILDELINYQLEYKKRKGEYKKPIIRRYFSKL